MRCIAYMDIESEYMHIAELDALDRYNADTFNWLPTSLCNP